MVPAQYFFPHVFQNDQQFLGSILDSFPTKTALERVNKNCSGIIASKHLQLLPWHVHRKSQIWSLNWSLFVKGLANGQTPEGKRVSKPIPQSNILDDVSIQPAIPYLSFKSSASYSWWLLWKQLGMFWIRKTRNVKPWRPKLPNCLTWHSQGKMMPFLVLNPAVFQS